MRLLLVSDIHGQFQAFLKLMKHVDYKPGQDRLILLGDLIDRGPKSSNMLDWAIDNNVEVIRGNHEHMFLSYMAGVMPEYQYFDNFIGGLKTVESYEGISEAKLMKHLQFLGKMPNYIIHDKFIFVHGGYNISKPLHQQTINDLVWDENIFFKGRGLDGRIIVFGHHNTNIIRQELNQCTVNHSEIWYDTRFFNKIGIDCSYASMDKRMACLDLTNGVEYYVNVYSNDREVKIVDKSIRQRFGF